MADPSSLDVPFEIETRRLVLRCPSESDGAVVHASVRESLEDLRRFGGSLPWSLEEPSVDVSSRYCRDARVRFLAREEMAYLVFTKEEATHVGNCGLHDIDWRVPKCEIGWWGRSSMLGRGLMTEAIAALLSLAFERLGMRRVEALPEAGNERSCRLCERVGLQLEGTLRNCRIAPDGSLRDVRVYASIR